MKFQFRWEGFFRIIISVQKVDFQLTKYCHKFKKGVKEVKNDDFIERFADGLDSIVVCNEDVFLHTGLSFALKMVWQMS